MKYYIAKIGNKVVGKHYGRKETLRQEFPDAQIFEVDEDIYLLVIIGNEY